MSGRPAEFFEKLATLGRAGQAFAVATVVARRAPVSAHLGDRAIVYADGRMEGFVGGACSREIARKQALEAIRARQPRLVSIRPDATTMTTSDPEHVIVPMTCASEGAIDVYIEPFVHARRLVVVGATPVAEALARTASSLDYDVTRVVDARDQRDVEALRQPGVTVASLDALGDVMKNAGMEAAVVVASQGHYDEEALQAVLAAPVSYVGLVASRKRAATVRSVLEDRGVSNLDAIRNPAGLDLGARTAPEVAVSILAEIVQTTPERRSQGTTASSATTESPDSTTIAGLRASPATTAVDPVCHMDVEIATARHSAEVDGTTYYFCCAGCRVQFVKDPHAFLSSPA
jgi:xanthine dehydrogenase accessory factor